MGKPNFFKFGTSEATQDAFICWLLDWAKPELKSINSNLHDTAQLLIKAFFKKAGKELEEDIESIEPAKSSRIDIERIINNKYHLIIEDKTKTKNRPNQLKDYLEKAKKKYQNKIIIPIYFKTYDQSDYKKVKEEGFTPFLRSDFLSVLEHGKNLGVTNEIFIDFYNHLNNINDNFESYKKPINEWTYRSWQGFYTALKEQLGKANWKYEVGRRLIFAWGKNDHKKIDLFLQLEAKRKSKKSPIYIKIEVKPNFESQKDISRIRDNQSKKMKEELNKLDLGFIKPKNFGHGKTMTILKSKDDFRKLNSDNTINMDETVKYLQKIEKAIKPYQDISN